MTYKDLDRLLHEFKEYLSSVTNPPGVACTRHDWRPVWALAKTIQEGFPSGANYPTQEQQQDAWRRFNELRGVARILAKKERIWLETKSKQHRDIILDICKGVGWSPIPDMLISFDQTTVEQMKGFRKSLSQAGRELQERKHEMFAKHKKECFAQIEEIKEQHAHFWSQYRQAGMTNGDKYEIGRAAFKAGIEENLSKNLKRLQKANDAKKRLKSEARELRLKIKADDADKKWHKTWSKWIEERKAHIADIEELIQRIEKWIGEDRRKLATIE